MAFAVAAKGIELLGSETRMVAGSPETFDRFAFTINGLRYADLIAASRRSLPPPRAHCHGGSRFIFPPSTDRCAVQAGCV